MSLYVDNVAPAAGGTEVELQPALTKAYGNCNQTGTMALRDSFNLSSITDAGTGHTKFNFTNVMADGNYTTSGWSGLSGATSWTDLGAGTLNVASQFSLLARNNSAAVTDADTAMGTAVGDLA